jgi:CHASE2 domain-containing sensor protein
MKRVFISYRRDDSAANARLIRNELSPHFDVFMDVDDIGWGDDFARVIDEHMARADVVVVVIGPHWTRLIEERARGDDWVRHEVKSALARRERGRLRVLPVLVGGAERPTQPLPPDMAPLFRLDVRELRDRALRDDMARLVEAVQEERFDEREERERRERRSRRWAALLGPLLFLAAWLALFELLGLDTRMQALTLRAAHALPGGAAPAWSGGVVLLALDDKARAAVGRPLGPDWRDEVAVVVGRVAAAGARTLAIDLSFEDPGSPAADAALERALAAAKARMPIVVAVQRLEQGQPALLARLRPHVSWGVACLGQRQDLALLLPLVLRRGEGASAVLWPSLGLAAFTGGVPLRSAAQLDALALALPVARAGDDGTALLQGFSAETLRNQPTGCGAMQPGDFVVSQWLDGYAVPPLDGARDRVSFADVLRGDPAALQALRGRIVLMGVMSGDEDVHRTQAATRHGVELLAAQVDALLRGAAVRPLPPLPQALMLLALAVAGAAVATGLRGSRRRWTWLAIVGLALAFGLGCVLWYRSEQQLVAPHYGWLALVLGAGLARRMTRE